MSETKPYSADRSLYGKLRRRFARLSHTRPIGMPGVRRPMLTISFDDAPASSARNGAAILKSHGVKGTWFISAGMMGQDSHMGPMTSGDDIRALHAAGFEIACHTYGHLDCGRASKDEIDKAIEDNQSVLHSLGIPMPRTFAYPYGDVSPQAKAVVDKRYLASRALHHGLIIPGTDLNQAPAVGIEGDDGERVAMAWLDRAARTPQSWLVLYTHDVRKGHSPFGCTPEVLNRIVAKGVELGFDFVTFASGAERALMAGPASRAA
ncbi:polysaccharide deacetylase [Asticcacaulis sp. AC460]|uniref:polysaccharide deacetylase family protein n=1 Tax=Asticcacaulis sp. AC460 TaxID=1282360 RepID=UPI0003C3E7D4|nr:polysaccharide deacetylase family protein [Asticcacaulis sp. AC460]ESQ89140.1 polysaccharide deacetylase [Asticcacaulis sp. AC460]